MMDVTGGMTHILESAEASINGTARFLTNGTSMTPYYTIRDYLGSVRTIVNASGTVVERNDYYPFGTRTTFGASYATIATNRQKFSGKEDQTAVAGSTLPYLDFGARMYDAKLVRWNTYDPMAEKYYGINPYVYCGSNPVRFIDDKGREPILPYAGTINGFVNFMNRIPTGIGLSTGMSAHAAMLRMGEVNGLKPANTAPFNSSDNNRYIYTEIGGWIDMAHFMFYAGRAYRYRQIQQQANDVINNSSFRFLSPESQAIWIIRAGMNPVNKSIKDGYLQEFSDTIRAPQSAYSYEDLPSDKYGAIFGAHFFNPDSKQSFSEQILLFFTTILKATDPMDAPNIKALPNDYPDKPTMINKTTNPLFIKY